MKVDLYVEGIEERLRVVRELVEENTGIKLTANMLRKIKNSGGFTLYDVDHDKAIKLVNRLFMVFKVNSLINFIPEDDDTTSSNIYMDIDPYDKWDYYSD